MANRLIRRDICSSYLFFLSMFSTIMCCGISAKADSRKITIIEDNDGLLPDGWDRHYTQGFAFSYVSQKLGDSDRIQGLYSIFPEGLPIFVETGDASRKFEIIVGQDIFTPVKYHNSVPDPSDRPFAGFMYGGGNIMQETGGHTLEQLEVVAGIVGPSAFGRQTQEAFHALVGLNNSNLDLGWSHQLRDEPGAMISYTQHRKLWQISMFGLQADLIPEAGMTIGNVMTYGEIGGQFRIGQNIKADYGIDRIKPALSGSGWFDSDKMESLLGWYIFGGFQSRGVLNNIFLDGNNFKVSPSVRKNHFVSDLSVGASIFVKDIFKIDASFTERTKEFTAQKQDDHFGNVNLSLQF